MRSAAAMAWTSPWSRMPVTATCIRCSAWPSVRTTGGPPPALHDAADELVRAAIGLGGTISGEHGVGITKRTWLDAEIGGRQCGFAATAEGELRPARDPESAHLARAATGRSSAGRAVEWVTASRESFDSGRFSPPMVTAGHEFQYTAPAFWTATLPPRRGAPGEDLASTRIGASAGSATPGPCSRAARNEMTQHEGPRTSWAMTAVSRRHVDQGRLSSALCCC